jgi:6-phosphogluconolactonase
MTSLRLQVVPDADSITHRGASVLADLLRRAIQARGSAVFAVSGGTTPWPMFERLVQDTSVHWDNVDLVQVDERVLPDGDVDRNWTRIQQVFIDNGPIATERSHPMPVTATDLYAACGEYARVLRELRPDGVMDVVHLGIGTDGHFASLAPGDPVCSEMTADIATTFGPFNGTKRMTMTRRLLDAADTVLWQISGAAKQKALRKVLDGDLPIPGGVLRSNNILVLADADAQGD